MKLAKARSGRSILLRLALLAFAVYLVVQMAMIYAELKDKEQILAQKQTELEAFVLKNEELTNLLRNGSDKEIIERAARDRLGYVYRDEIVFKQKR